MTATVGITPYLADSWLNSLNNTPFVVPMMYWQLHVGIPGLGTENPSQTTLRVPGTFAQAANGLVTFGTQPPIWQNTIVAEETLTYCSGWDSLTGGNCLVTGQLLLPTQVAAQDIYALGSFTFGFPATALASA